MIQTQLLHGAQQLYGEVAQIGHVEHVVDLDQQHGRVAALGGETAQRAFVVLPKGGGACQRRACPARHIGTGKREPLRVQLATDRGQKLPGRAPHLNLHLRQGLRADLVQRLRQVHAIPKRHVLDVKNAIGQQHQVADVQH